MKNQKNQLKKRVNSVPIEVEFNFTKKLEGRELKAGEFTFELKDSDNVVIATTSNDANGNFKSLQLTIQTKLVKLSLPLNTRRVKKVLTLTL